MTLRPPRECIFSQSQKSMFHSEKISANIIIFSEWILMYLFFFVCDDFLAGYLEFLIFAAHFGRGLFTFYHGWNAGFSQRSFFASGRIVAGCSCVASVRVVSADCVCVACGCANAGPPANSSAARQKILADFNAKPAGWR